MRESSSVLITMVRAGNAPAVRSIPPGYSIRRVTIDDKEAWRRLVNESLNTVLPLSVIRSWFGGGDNIFFCECEGNPVGTSGLHFLGGKCYINYTGVLVRHRNKGLGVALVCAALRLAEERGKDEVFVATTLQPLRYDAIRMYYKLGFRASGPVPCEGVTWEELFKVVRAENSK